MPHRTSLILDDETDRAARELALHFKCSSTEAIRRSVVRYRDLTLGLNRSTREQRRKILSKLFELFADNDPDEEIARLKREDEGF